MSILTVVRHGQASFLADDYDKLSPLGETQSRKLAEYWLRRSVRFDQVFHGPRQRQIRTCAIAGAVFRQAGAPWPDPQQIDELDEYPAERVVRTFLPELRRKHKHLERWAAEFFATEDPDIKRRSFDRLLHEVTRRWIEGEVASAEIPSWDAFLERVAVAIRRIRESCLNGSRVVVFTSGGPTAATARIALDLGPLKTLDLTWMPRNASFSEFLFSGARFTMATFNCTPHLDPEELTYR
jgi:broad specificity phosphatase PhoE